MKTNFGILNIEKGKGVFRIYFVPDPKTGYAVLNYDEVERLGKWLLQGIKDEGPVPPPTKKRIRL